MKEKIKSNLVLRAIACGLLTFLISYLIVPLFASGISDVIWITALILIPSVLGGVLLWKVERYIALYVIISAAIQYALWIVLAGFVDGIWGSNIESTLGWLSYIGSTFLFPVVIAAIQWGGLTVVRKLRG